jgi:hypothetical protein
MKTELVSIDQVQLSPDNPRVIKNDKFRKLVKSIEEFPEMLKVRPIVVDDDMVVLGGNMRLRACLEAGLKEVHILKASEFSDDQKKEFVIKDNSSFGEWDWETLANEWDVEKLDEWGLDLPSMAHTEETYTTKVESPIYETKVVKPTASELYDLHKYNTLLSDIEKADISEADKQFLMFAAMRHIKFNYSKIADYYAHSDKEVQELMENSALVIIDYDKAIEKGFVQLFKTFDELSDLDG